MDECYSGMTLSIFLPALITHSKFSAKVYAFNNLHDVSWGTKGSDKADVLPSVSTKKGDANTPAVAEDTKMMQEDIDAAFKETVDRATSKLKTDSSAEKPTLDVSCRLPPKGSTTRHFTFSVF